MEANSKINPPVNLNCWKHHAGFIIDQINSIKSTKELDKLKNTLLKVGESQMDLYYGELSPQDISKQILDYLKQNNFLLSGQYKKWLNKYDNVYQLTELSDKSVWTLRIGDKIERYVHIHPGRYSPQTIRVKANTLKTAILVLCFRQLGEIEVINTETINQIRKKYLNEPPLKSFFKASGLQKTLNLLSKI